MLSLLQFRFARTVRFVRPRARRVGLASGLAVVVLGFLLLSPGRGVGQQILLDEGVRAGPLMVYPVMGTDFQASSDYYYLADQIRLATDEEGRPEFSFLRFLDVVRPGAGEEVEREGEGGGIVHAVVQLEVSQESLREAQSELSKVRSGGRIVGPVAYRSGTFGLVSAFAEENGDLTHRVVGLGKAPLLDGQRAAVSIRLTRLGAKILWEAFHMPTPDVSFEFEMEVAGLRSPTRVLLEADWERVYKQQAFQVGIAATFLAGEIAGEFDALRDSAAIRIVQVGDDEDMERAVDVAYNKLMQVMFEPVESSDLPGLEQMARQAGQPSIVDRATTLLASARADARQRNQQTTAASPTQATSPTSAAADTPDSPDQNPQAGLAVAAKSEAYEQALRKLFAQEKKLVTLEDRQRIYAVFVEEPQGQTTAEARRVLTDVETQLDDARRALETQREATAAAREALQAAETSNRAARLARGEAGAPPVVAAGRPPEAGAAGGAVAAGGGSGGAVREPAFAVVAALRLRRSRATGMFKLDMNKYTPDAVVLPFDGNIGDLSQYLDDPDFFRDVNLDEQRVFRQRAVSFRLAGLDADDFGDYVNFVHVQLRRGENTREELTVGREEFSRAGNNFPLIYGWSQGEESVDDWETYEYRTVWSFFQGLEVEQPWQTSNSGAVPLAPPFERRQVEVTANPQDLQDAGVRAVTARLYYSAGDEERYSEVLLRPDLEVYAGLAEVILPAGEAGYEYEVLWQLRGGQERSSGRLSSSASLLFVDQVPRP